MRGSMLLGLGTLALGAGIGWLWLRGADRPGPAVPTVTDASGGGSAPGAGDEPTDLEQDPDVRTTGGSGDERDAPGPAASVTHRVPGRVNLPSAMPRGERVRVFASGPAGDLLAETEMQPDGRFELVLEDVRSARVDIAAPHLFLRQPRHWRAPRSAERAPRPFELAASLGGRLEVRYRLDPGASAPASGPPPTDLGLRVDGEGPPRTATAVEGVATFDALRPGNVRLSVDGGAWSVAGEAGHVVVPGKTGSAELVLHALARVEGRVVDAAGEGVEGVSVYAPDWPRPGASTAVTASDGSFGLDVPAPEQRLAASGPAWGTTEVRVDGLVPGETRTDVELAFTGRSGLVGRVELEGGEPVRAALVLSRAGEASDGRPRRERLRELETRADGRFRFQGLAAGTYDLFAREIENGPGLPRSASVRVRAGEGETVLTLERGEGLKLRVRDDADRPVARCEVELVRQPAGLVHRGSELGRGVLELSPLSPGRYTLRVRARGHAPAQLEFDHPGLSARNGILVQLARLARVSGRVLRPDGLPASGARVLLRDAVATCDELGRFELGGVLPGDAPIRAVAEGFEDGPPRELDVAAGDVREGVELRLGPAR